MEVVNVISGCNNYELATKSVANNVSDNDN